MNRTQYLKIFNFFSENDDRVKVKLNKYQFSSLIMGLDKQNFVFMQKIMTIIIFVSGRGKDTFHSSEIRGLCLTISSSKNASKFAIFYV